MKCFLFPQKFCVVYLVIKRRHKTSISFIFKLLKKFLENKGKLLLKLKHVRNVVVVIILVVIVCTFCWTNISAAMSGAVFHNPLHNQLHSPRHMCCGDVTVREIWFDKKKTYFDGLPWIPLHLCVYDMRIVLLEWNGQTLIKWLSEQFWRCC